MQRPFSASARVGRAATTMRGCPVTSPDDQIRLSLHRGRRTANEWPAHRAKARQQKTRRRNRGREPQPTRRRR